MKGPLEFFQTVFGFLGGWHVITDVLRNVGGPLAKEKLEGILKNNPRGDFLRVLLTISKTKAEKMWQNIEKAKTEGGYWENDVIVLLGNLIPRKEDGQIDETKAKKLYEQISEMKKDEFFRHLETLKHDPFAQRIKVYLKKGKGLLESILEAASEGLGWTNAFLDDWAKRKEKNLQNPGWFARLSRKFIR